MVTPILFWALLLAWITVQSRLGGCLEEAGNSFPEGARKQKEKVFEAITLFFRSFIITSYYTREALRNPKNEWSALCRSRLSGEQGELQDLTSKRPCCADCFESNWSGQTRQTPDGLEVLAKLWRSTWEKPDAQSPA